MSDVYANNVTLGTDTKIFKVQSLSSFEMSNGTFIEVHPEDPKDSSTKLIELSSITLSDGIDFSISDVQIEGSTVGLIELSNIQSSENLTTSFFIRNFTYLNSYFEYSQDLISFTQIETSNNFSIVINSINMQNITFVSTGNLFVFSQQTSLNLSLTDAYFNNLYGARIYIKSSNLQNTDLFTSIEMRNITATNLSGFSASFIAIDEGGRIFIYDSSFTNIDNIERGAVLNAGYQNSQTQVYNSTFKNNMSIYGGVANIQDNSVIKFFDCNFTYNFALQSGVIQSSNNGYYELYRSYINNNYANSLSVSEIFIVTQPSIFSNCTVFDNLVLTKSQIVSEFDQCSTL